ncbi:unnamed protein product [Pocillopora meandrina]|uniref:Secreted protein n=1 Tax=Pocillopora meandrina TaxID=46732 RepID=A0AAU9VLQ7_9CNID|nr:unnamed protein product [Pocillopora meandrina]
MTSIPIYLTLWVLVVFVGPPDEDILMIKVRTKHGKSQKTHTEHKALKNVPASGLSCSYYSLRRIRFWEVEVDFPSHGSQLSLALLLSKSVEHETPYTVDMKSIH